MTRLVEFSYCVVVFITRVFVVLFQLMILNTETSLLGSSSFFAVKSEFNHLSWTFFGEDS